MAKQKPQTDFDAFLDELTETGKGITVGDTLSSSEVKLWLPSGSLSLDWALSNGRGYPVGRVTEIFADEGSGKSTLGGIALAETQRAGGVACVIDAENKFDRPYAERLGVNYDRLIRKLKAEKKDNETVEGVFEFLGDIALKVRNKFPDRFVTVLWDSVAATSTEEEEEGKVSDKHIASHAKTLSQAFRQKISLIGDLNICLIIVNQVKEKTNIKYGNKLTTFGGRAIKFHATCRVGLEIAEILHHEKDGKPVGDPYGIQTVAKVVKNQIAPPFRKAYLDILFGESLKEAGIDKGSDVLYMGMKFGLIKQNGSWFLYGDERLGQGEKKVAKLLRDEDGLRQQIEKRIREEMTA